MSYITQEYDLNMIPGGVPVRVPVSQYDAGSRTITFNLYAGAEQFSVPTSAAAQINGTKPDGKSFSYAADINGSSVSATITEQMTAAAGRVNCEIALLNGSNFLGSANFVLLVEKAALPEDADLSETELSTIQSAITETKGNADAAAGSATEAAASAAEAKQILQAAKDKDAAKVFTCSMDENGSLKLASDSTFDALTTAVNAGKACFLQVLTDNNDDAEGDLMLQLEQFLDGVYAAFTSAEIYQKGSVSVKTVRWLSTDNIFLVQREVISKQNTYAPSSISVLKSNLDTELKMMGGDEIRYIHLEPSTAISAWRSKAVGMLWHHSDNDATVEITTIDGYKLRMVKDSGTWGDLLWENPPMLAGVSYATTEKWQAKTVYCRLINCGAISQMATVDISGMNAATIIRYSGTVNGTPIPYGVAIDDSYGGDSSYFGRIEVNKSINNVVLYENGLSGTWTVTLWYTIT